MRSLSFSVLAIVCVLFVGSASFAATPWPAFQAGLTPGESSSRNKAELPSNLTVIPAASNVPAGLAAYLGTWTGWMSANRAGDAKIAVVSATADGAIVHYADATSGRKSEAWEIQAKFVDGELVGDFGGSFQLALALRPDGNMNVRRLNTKNNGWTTGILARAEVAHATSVEKSECSIERANYKSDDLNIDAFIMRPKGNGPFPVLVYNHGSNLTVEKGRLTYIGGERATTVSMASDCWELTKRGIIAFVPEGRGYGNSDGDRPIEAFDKIGVVPFIVGRARDVNAGVRWLLDKPYVAKNCIALYGASHGGIVSLIAAPYLDAAGVNYRAVLAASSGLSSIERDRFMGFEEVEAAVERTPFPIYLWHVDNDQTVSPETSKRIAEFARSKGKQVSLEIFKGKDGVNGHSIMYVAGWQNREIWGASFDAALASVFRGCS